MPFLDLAPQALARMSQDQLDHLPFGVLELDMDGVIQRINSVEAERTGRVPEHLVGKNFFSEIAPCTDVRAFAGIFREGVRTGSLNTTFAYRFDFQAGAQEVIVHLACYRAGDGWVLITR